MSDLELEKSLPYIKNFRNALDIGSCEGTTVLDFSKKFEHVYAFEPLKETFQTLIENTKHLDNVTCYNYAVGESAGEIQITNLVGHPWRNKILDEDGKKFLDYRVKSRKLSEEEWSIETVNLINIDSFEFTNIDFVKIDTEGYVLPVLKGMEKTLIENNPPAIFVEVLDTNRRVFEFLSKLGYSNKRADKLNFIFYK